MRETNYDVDSEALRLACSRIGQFDPGSVAEKSGCIFLPGNDQWMLNYLGQKILVERDGGAIRSQRHVTKTERLLILHYLMKAGGSPLRDKYKAFRDIPMGGNLYAPTFDQRAIAQVAEAFGEQPDAIYKHMDALGGRKTSLGDASVTLQVLPRLPITYIVWGSDEELPHAANILFDASIDDYMCVEDVVMIASLAAYALIDGPSAEL